MNERDNISLKELIDTKIQALRDAIDKAEKMLDARLQGMNEFRESLRDQTAKTIGRDEYLTAHKALEDKLRRLELDSAVRSGKDQQIAVFSAILSSIIVGAIIGIILHFMFK